MSGIDPRADPLLVNESRLGVTGYLRTATVTLLSAEVEGSMRLWQDKPDVMAAAMGRLNEFVCDVIATHGGMRPIEHGEGDGFEVAFTRAADAMAAALQLQRAPLLPIRLRIGERTGEVQLHDGDRFAAPGINRTARLRDLAHGGQTVLSGATAELVADRLPDGAWLTELGAHRLRDLPDPERVAQLCHPDLLNQFPPLRAVRAVGSRASSGAADQLRRPRGRTGRAATDRRGEPVGDVDRRGWGGQDPAGGAAGGPGGRPVPRRGVVCGSGDARDALALAAAIKVHALIPEILEGLAVIAGQGGSHREAARLFGAAEAIRLRIGTVRFKVRDAGHQASVMALRDAMGEQDFGSAWAEGAALSTEEAIGYAQRGRGQRKRPSSGWASLTPTEREVVRLVSAGLANNDIATQLFVSPRTVQTHLSHVYTKLGLSSRVQLAQEAARHS